jgi:hypothetical protein
MPAEGMITRTRRGGLRLGERDDAPGDKWSVRCMRLVRYGWSKRERGVDVGGGGGGFVV